MRLIFGILLLSVSIYSAVSAYATADTSGEKIKINTNDSSAHNIARNTINIDNINSVINTVVDIVITDKIVEPSDESGKKESSDGSGFIIDENGLIITNCHVIDNSDKIEIILYDGTKYAANVIGKDEKSDIALLKIDIDTKIPYVAKFADSESVNILDPVFAVGNPFGFGKTVTSGIVSFKGRNLSQHATEWGGVSRMVSYIQTDAAVNYGNSGGPLFTFKGEVCGMITVFVSDGMHSTGINFAIPANTIKNVVDQLKKYGKINRSWIGISVSPIIGKDVTVALGIGNRCGCDITNVEKGSPADIAGIRVSDILLSINGQDINTTTNPEYMLNNLPIDKIVPIQVMRDGIEMKFNLTVKSKNDDDIGTEIKEPDIGNNKISFEKLPAINIGVTDLTDEYRKFFDIPSSINGVLIANVENQFSEMSVGNVILKINHHKVSNLAELKRYLHEIIASRAKNVALYIYDSNKEQKQFYVAFKLVYSNNKSN